ncbi:hypothetical protein AGMMS49579_07020 [Spirochaetia bacterium]|nr:hypothetical protein AGMMS49579_07020 [Spirochaetia bacterium]
MPKTNLERLTTTILQERLFSDFVVDELNYRDRKLKGKELADIIYIFGNKLIVFQVKTRIISQDHKIDELQLHRITQKVDEAIGQIKSSVNQLTNMSPFKLKTARGFEINLEKNKISEIIGVVIIGVEDERGINITDNIDLSFGYQNKFNVPIHIFKINDFEEILNELDTFADFKDYLDIRQRLLCEQKIFEYCGELDLLGAFIFRRDDINKSFSKDSRIIIEHGYWRKLKYSQTNLEYKVAIKHSYIIDEIINTMHKGVGFNIEDEFNGGIEGSKLDYFETVYEMASLNRLSRKEIGNALYQKTVKAVSAGSGYALLFLIDENIAVVILSFNGDRKKRRTTLMDLTSCAYAVLDEFDKSCNKVIGIATEPADEKYRSYDVSIFENLSLANTTELKDRKGNDMNRQNRMHDFHTPLLIDDLIEYFVKKIDIWQRSGARYAN